MAKTPAWQRSEGKNPSGGLNEKGRASLRAAGHDIKRPQPEGGSRKDSFCARMKGMKAKLTSSETANDPDSRINKSLRKWKCADGGALEVARKYKDAGGRIYRQNKSPWQRESETTPRSMSPSTQKYLPSDVTPEISKDQYKKGKLGKDDYALAKGGAASYRKARASGGNASGYKIPQFSSDAEAMAHMMWSEADILRSHPDAQNAIISTGWSAKNRALSGFPEGMPSGYRNTHNVHSITDQITNPGGSGYGAYSYFNKTRADMARKAFEKNPALKEYYMDLANGIISGRIEDPTGGSVSYYNPLATKGTPNWAGPEGKKKGWYDTVRDEKGAGGFHKYLGHNTYTPIALAAQKREADILAQRGTPKGSAGDFKPKDPPPVQTPDERSQNAFFQKYLYGADPDYENFEGDVDFDTSLLNRMYDQLYGRKAPEAEVSYLKDRLDKGEFDMGDLFTYMSKTPEAKQYGDTQLDKLYQENYGRKASDYEKNYLNNRIAEGTLTRDDLAAYLPTTAEAKTYGNAQLDKIYNESFGRKITDQEREYINQAIANKQLSRGDLASYLPTTSEGKSWTAVQEAQKKADAEYQQKLAKYQSDVNAYNFAKTMYDLYGNPAVKSMSVPVAPTKPGQYVSGFNPAVQYGWNNQNQNQNLGQQLVGIGAGGNVGAGSTGAGGGATAPIYTGTNPGYSGGSAPPGYTYTAPDLTTGSSPPPPSNLFGGSNWSSGTGSLPIGTGTGITTKVFEPILPSNQLPSSFYQYSGTGGMPSYLSGLPSWQGPSQSASILPSGNGNPYSPGSSTYYGTGGTGGYTGSGGLGIITITRNAGGRVGRNAGGALNDAMGVAKVYKKGGPVWSKPRPKSIGKPTPLSSGQKASAKAMAKAAGRPYPNLVDNMRAAKKS